jgi:hypothetical protein
MIEMPIERAQKFGRLLRAARFVRDERIPNTSSTTAQAMSTLLETVAEFDDPDPGQ